MHDYLAVVVVAAPEEDGCVVEVVEEVLHLPWPVAGVRGCWVRHPAAREKCLFLDLVKSNQIWMQLPFSDQNLVWLNKIQRRVQQKWFQNIHDSNIMQWLCIIYIQHYTHFLAVK